LGKTSKKEAKEKLPKLQQTLTTGSNCRKRIVKGIGKDKLLPDKDKIY
jgi:hypothetical protein